ncbi:MAG: polymorphic toxin-type HINT domain-containing protein, partial [Granulosicoccaceae bacterium]
PDRKHYYQADPPRLPITSVAIGRMQTAARKDEAQLSLKTKLDPGGTGTVPPEDFSEEDAEEQREELEGEDDDPKDPTDPTDPTDPEPEEEIECETKWTDDQYNGWLKGNWNAAKDFFTGLIDGFKQQLGDIWELVKDVFTDWDAVTEILKSIWDDPIQFLKDVVQALMDDLGEKAQQLMNCGPKDIGRIIGEEVSPVAALNVVGKIAKISDKLAKYIKKIEDVCASFPAGTLIWTPSGAVPIESLEAYDIVVSRDDAGFSTSTQPILDTFDRLADNYISISLEYGSEIALTDEHPVWVQGAGWMTAGDIQPGDILATLDGDISVLKSERVAKTAPVYNFSVKNTPSYFASDAQIWVHNANKVCELPTRYDSTYKGLTTNEIADFKRRIAAAGGNTPEADEIRWERYKTNKERLGETADRDKWDEQLKTIRDNRTQGIERETNARNDLDQVFGEDAEIIDNNAKIECRVQCDNRVETSIPDTIVKDQDGNVIAIVEHKDVSGQNPVVYNTGQLEGQRTGTSLDANGNEIDTSKAKHYVAISSDAPVVDGTPTARPSGPLGEKSTVLYYDHNSGKYTHTWDRNSNSWVAIE